MDLKNPYSTSLYSASGLDPNDEIDMRGCEVYDRNHCRVGIISEIYCSYDDLTAKYVEIVPFDRTNDKYFIYPFDSIDWKSGGPAFLNSTYDALKRYKDYDAEVVLAKERDQLISYNDALDIWLGEPRWNRNDFRASA